MIRLRCVVAGLLIAAAGSGGALAEDDIVKLKPVGEAYAVDRDLIGERDKTGKADVAKDVSGIACLPPVAGRRRCVIVNDENTGAQFVSIDGSRIVAGDEIPLIGESASAATLGTAPERHDCSAGPGKFNTLDGEAVAYANPYIYVAGSHGCSRGGKKFKLSSFILARFRVDDKGERVGAGLEAVETTYRLSDALKGADIVGPHFAKDLETDPASNGLNLEGLAIVDGRLFAGLRAPSLGGKAYIVEARVDDLFAPGHGRLAAKAMSLPVEVGPDAGIRDMTVLPNKRLLVLTGPARTGADAPYRLLSVSTTDGQAAVLGQLKKLKADEKDGKAEAVTLLGPGRILVLFDGLENGGPREYALPPPN